MDESAGDGGVAGMVLGCALVREGTARAASRRARRRIRIEFHCNHHPRPSL
jgi:hypothetical protein